MRDLLPPGLRFVARDIDPRDRVRREVSMGYENRALFSSDRFEHSTQKLAIWRG